MATVDQSLSFDPAAGYYDRMRGGEERGRRIATAIAGRFRDDRPLLEVGVGTGVVALGLRGLGHTVCGLDLSLEMLRRAAPRVGNVMNASADALPLADGVFDQAYSVWLLHVVADQRAVLTEVHRVLRPGGRYVVVPGVIIFDDHPINAALDEVQRRTGTNDDRAEVLLPLAREAGFRAVEVSELPPTTHRYSPNQIADALERRVMFHLWPLDDEAWARDVQPSIDALRALPDPDVAVPRTTRRQLIVLERED
jgi:ubiquinone/menaquinone biosynthesis C-methylase UbiE